MADDRNHTAAARQNEPRQGSQGKGFDAGTGSGGAGNDAGQGGAPNVARDTDGRGSENQRADVPRDPDVEAVTQAFEGNVDTSPSGVSRDGPDAIDLEDMSGATRREPGR